MEPDSIRIPSTLANLAAEPSSKWQEPHELSKRINLARSGIVAAILEWHIEHAAKPLIVANESGFQRVAEDGAMMRTAYSYRLWNLWCLAKQLCPTELGKNEYPSWLETATGDEDEENGDE